MNKDKTNTQRQAAYTARLQSTGGRRVTVTIPADINARLLAEQEKTGSSANAIILRLLENNLPG